MPPVTSNPFGPVSPLNTQSGARTSAQATTETPATESPAPAQPTQDGAQDRDTFSRGSALRMARTQGERRAARDGFRPVAERGMNLDTGVAYAQASGISGSKNGASADVLSASVQSGSQTEAEAVMARVGYESERKGFGASMEVVSARVSTGTVNPDGSRGLNVGVSANVISGEVSSSGALIDNVVEGSVTAGVGIGLGAEASAGVRDQDGDGRPEVCARATLKPGIGLTVGACIELPRFMGMRVR